MEWSPWSGSRCCRLLTNTSNGYATGLGSRAGCPEPFSLVLHAEDIADSPVVALREPDLNQRAIDSVAVEENSLFAVVSW
ncbi:MAG: hypothetical protein WBO95_05065 [Candidatus Dechloromonas phosphoritropha]